MENKQIITLAYELARTKYKDKPFTFDKLWTDLVKKAKLDKDEQSIVGHVYTCMLQDHRFIFIGNHEWKIRKFLKEEEQEALSHKLYDFSQELKEEQKRLEELTAKEKDERGSFYTDEEEAESKRVEDKERFKNSPEEDDESESEQEENEQEDEEDVE